MASSVDSVAPPPPTSLSGRDLDNDDLDPAAFLKSVRELSEKREREDVERYRKLEEEVEKSRAARVARRQERARSISPEKSSIAPVAHALRSLNGVQAGPHDALIPQLSPRAPTAHSDPAMAGPPSPTKDIPEFRGFGSTSKSNDAPRTAASPTQTAESSPRPAQSASSLARSGTLSWQRRPTSRAGGGRPVSMFVSEKDLTASPPSRDEQEPSREEITAKLATRDPAWFKQTAERGTGSAAFRKSMVESAGGDNVFSGRRGMPGMSRESTREPEREASPASSESVSLKSASASRPNSLRDSAISNGMTSTGSPTSRITKPDLKSLIAADAPQQEAALKSDPPLTARGDHSAPGHRNTMSASQSNISNQERPPSPTKGAGGFVQSAMMRRSDSVNKRWSTQPGSAGLSRQNSLASQRSGFSGLQGSLSMPRLEPTPGSRESSHEPLSRPSSGSSSNLNAVGGPSNGDTNDGFVKPAMPYHSRSKSMASLTGEAAASSAVPASPSKRFSPTKSSWIESALTRPESPKPAAPKNTQPSWMADIAKAKAQRASADLTPRDVSEIRTAQAQAPHSQTPLRRPESRDLGPTLQSASLAATAIPTESRDVAPPSLDAMPASQVESRKSRDVAVLTKAMRGSEGKASAIEEPREARDIAIKTKALQESEYSASASKESYANPKAPVESSAPGVGDPGTNALESRSNLQSLAVQPAKLAQTLERREAKSLEAAKPSLPSKAKPEVLPKPQTDFRSTLRPRPQVERKDQETPEFLAKFAHLRKTATEKYVAPDVLKNNITRGKAELVKTEGPVKSTRRDELKESLLAKKEEWKQAKDDGTELPGQVHARKTSGAPVTPSKPEALTKRDMLSRTESLKSNASPEKTREATPEALTVHRSLKQKPPVASQQNQRGVPREVPPNMEPLAKQRSAPAELDHTASIGKSKLAARFNPALAGVLARGPPAVTHESSTHSRTAVSANPERSAATAFVQGEPAANGTPLQDMRKGRAKGPKKRRADETGASNSRMDTPAQETTVLEEEVSTKPEPPTEAAAVEAESMATPSKPRAPPGSAASLMVASLRAGSSSKPSNAESIPETLSRLPAVGSNDSATDKSMDPPTTPAAIPKPAPFSKPPVATPSVNPVTPTPTKSDVHTKPVSERAASSKPLPDLPSPADGAPTTVEPMVRDFGVPGLTTPTTPARSSDENKENTNNLDNNDNSPFVRSAASAWGQPATPKTNDKPPMIQLPSRRDEEAAMRSAGLLSSSSSSSAQPSSRSGPGAPAEKSNGVPSTPPASARLPSKPSKPSRAVSGQLLEASPNRGLVGGTAQTRTEAESLLMNILGTTSLGGQSLTIDARAVMADSQSDAVPSKTLRKSVLEVQPNGLSRPLPPREEYTFFAEAAYICTEYYMVGGSTRRCRIFLWTGAHAAESTIEHSQVIAKSASRENNSAPIRTLRQGLEMPTFLQAMGGILITRRGSRHNALQQFMLCGRKHFGQIVFDEMEFGLQSLCAGYAYLISYPVTLQDVRMYLWKGSASSIEEIGAARLAAMDLSATGEIIEVDQGAEFPSFLKIFGPGTAKSDILPPSHFWNLKAGSPHFAARLFKIQPAEPAKPSFLSGMFARRPSWNSLSSSAASSPARSPSRDAVGPKVTAVEISPFTQADLDAEALYVLDAFGAVYVLLGPLFASLAEIVRGALGPQALLFAREVVDVASRERGIEVTGEVVVWGCPDEMKMLFRHWDADRGLWGTAALMAGGSHAGAGGRLKVLRLDDVLKD